MLSAEDAIFIATCHNNLQPVARLHRSFAEPIAYDELRKRYDWHNELRERDEYVERKLAPAGSVNVACCDVRRQGSLR